MQIQPLSIKNQSLFCFRCRKFAAEHRVTINIKHGGRLMICLCPSCSRLSETELYAHFMTYTKPVHTVVRGNHGLADVPMASANGSLKSYTKASLKTIIPMEVVKMKEEDQA